MQAYESSRKGGGAKGGGAAVLALLVKCVPFLLQVKLGKELGVGDFGKVLQGEARKLLPGQKKTTVVIKQLKLGATAEEREAFLRPVEAMK